MTLLLILAAVAIALLASAFVDFRTPQLPRGHRGSTAHNIWRRYHPQSAHPVSVDLVERGDRAQTYLERVVDRLATKTVGILSFNALVVALLAVERTRVPASQSNDLAFWGMGWLSTAMIVASLAATILLGWSSMICLNMLRVRWSGADSFITFEQEFYQTVEVIANRTGNVNRAVGLSIAGVVVTAICIGLAEWRLSMPPADSPRSGRHMTVNLTVAGPPPATCPVPHCRERCDCCCED